MEKSNVFGFLNSLSFLKGKLTCYKNRHGLVKPSFLRRYIQVKQGSSIIGNWAREFTKGYKICPLKRKSIEIIGTVVFFKANEKVEKT